MGLMQELAAARSASTRQGRYEQHGGGMAGDDFLANMEAARAERKVLELAANARLVQSGFFQSITGPENGIPIQAEGVLTTGETFDFWARCQNAEITVNGTLVSCEEVGQEFLCAGMMTPDEAATRILKYLESRK